MIVSTMLLSASPSAIEEPSASDPASPVLQRARGSAHVSFKLRDGKTALDTLRQSGCAKIRLPRIAGTAPVAVLLNTAGGITGGDQLDCSARWDSGTRAMVTSQAAERIYRRVQGVGQVTNTLHIADGARAEWLPQETIVFDRAGLTRRFSAHLEGSAQLLALETVVLGRKAMGETVTKLDFHDRWRIYRDGHLVFADDTRLCGDASEILKGPATGGGANCFATLIDIGPHAVGRLEAARDLLGACRSEAGASAWNDMLVIRFISSNSQQLRGDLITFLESYRGEELPRVWHC